MNNVQERLTAAAIGPLVSDAPGEASLTQRPADLPFRSMSGDAVNLLQRPMSGTMNAGAMSIFAQLVGFIQQLLSSFGGSGRSYFQNATAASTGDPHLAFDGTDAHGNAHHARFDSMQGHKDLLDSSSFSGGYRISTQVTQPAANGVTYNREASISTDFGNTRVSLDNSGNARIVSNDRTIALAQGQTVDLGDGESATHNNDGSLTVTDSNGFGGTIATRLSENGAGVDVNVQSQNVELGGDLVNAAPPADGLRRLQ